jgi:Pilus formation protein N terminal region
VQIGWRLTNVAAEKLRKIEMNLLRNTLSALSLAILSSSAAFAAQELVLKTDQTQLLSVSGSPGAVVIGNPSIADATVHGSQIFIHGRAFGGTNLIVLDRDGNQLAAFEVTVQIGGNNNMALFAAGNRYSYVCAPLCETAMQVGDEFTWTDSLIKLNQKKGDLATGKTSAQSAAAPAPAQ